MKKLDILKDPNPILRAQAEDVSSFDGQIQELIDDMIFTMRNSDGIGLAAPQVGQSKKIIVAEYETPEKEETEFPLCVVINPRIEDLSKEQEFTIEGCLSFPGKELYIKRPKGIMVRAQDRWGKEFLIEDEKLLARVLQHEIDHLNGVLMIDHIKTVKTIFVGNGSLGLPALERITDDPQFKLLGVMTSPDRITGKKLIQPTLIAELAGKLGQKVYKIADINSKETADLLVKLSPELIVITDFSQILKKEIFEIPKYGVLNIHPSLLPKYRGPSPVASTILAGDKKTGVSVIKINDQVDAGAILSQLEINVKSRETAIGLKKRLAEFGADLLAETVPYYLADEIRPFKQKEENVSVSKKFTKSDGLIRGDESPEIIDRMVRALYPWPGVYIINNDRKIFITKTHLDRSKSLIIDMVKPEGKREMSYKDYLAGNPKLTLAPE
ncbi:MAG: peptide deformylase [Patescibacteria group bacterium]